MPATPAKFPHLSQKHRKQILRLPIPKPQQGSLGRKMFRAVMPQTDPQSAYIASLPIIADWRRQIETAKTGSRDQFQAEILRLRTEYERYQGKPLDADVCEVFGRILDFLFQRFGGVSAAAQRLALADAKGDAGQALQTLPAPVQARHALQQIIGLETPDTPFLYRLEAFKETTHLKGKALAQTVFALKGFAKAVNLSLEALQGPGAGNTVQKWLDDLRRDRGLRSTTLMHKLSGLQAYWKWLHKREFVANEFGPFHRRDARDGRNGAEEADDDRMPFDPVDVPRLWRAAEEDGDPELFAAIKLGAYTGIRRNGICSLTASSVVTDRESGIRYFQVTEKTKSGRRKVPVHLAITDLVDAMIANADKDGYLFHSPGIDVFGYRGKDISVRFTALKAAMGFHEKQDFHSLRHTFQSGLEHQGVREKVRKNLMGHKVSDITDGRYGTVAPLTELRDGIEKLEY
jgi:integrase